MKIRFAFLLMLVAAIAVPLAPSAFAAVTVGETFSNPTMEKRSRSLQRQLRCLMCPGESIDESASPFANDVRRLMRQQMADGKNDRQILDYLVERYGDSILMKPPVKPTTWLLWLAPFLVLGAGGAVAAVVIKKAAARDEITTL
jgi:cytochrome c-type biogenesis protein CcmH